MSVWASRKSLPEVKTGIPGHAAKGTQAPELQKALTLKMIQSRCPKSTWTHVFTDGCAENAVRNGGSGAYIRRPDGTTSSLSIPAGDLSSNYRAEVHALKAVAFLFQVVPSFLAMLSCHLLLGRRLDLFPLLGCHSVQRLDLLLSFILAIFPCGFQSRVWWVTSSVDLLMVLTSAFFW